MLGFDGVALLLPEALGGIALVAALMWLLQHPAGPCARRSPEALALAVAALGGDRRPQRHDGRRHGRAGGGGRGRRRRGPRAAGDCGPWPAPGVLLGLAFEVKLAEALLPVCAAAALWWFAGPRARRPRAFGLGLLGGAFLASALAWLLIVTVVPLHPRPWALGASDGSPWRAALVYNGTARLLGGGGNPRARLRRAEPGREARPRLRVERPRGAEPRLRGARRRRARLPPSPAAPASTPPPSAAAPRRPGRCGWSRPRPTSGGGSASRRWPRWRRWPSRSRSGVPGGSAASAAAGCSRSCSGSSRASCCAAASPVCVRATWPAWIPPWRPAWGPGSRSPSARAHALRGSPPPWSCARSWLCRSPPPWPPWAAASRCRGAPGRCRRRAWPPCRTSCRRARPAPPTRSRSARRPRRAPSSPATRARC